jgi:hypothetical protein
MLVNTSHRVAATVAMVVVLVLVGLHARACSVRRDSGALPVAACVVAPDPAVASKAAVPGSVEPAISVAASDPAPAIPSLTLPCIADTTELLAAGNRPVLCWGERCLADPGDLTSTVPRPPSGAESEDAVVEGERVCTGTRCDRVGPRLGAAMASMTDPTVAATRDHAAIVLAAEDSNASPHFEVWNRAADRQIDLGSPDDDEGGISKVTVIGDALIVTRECLSKGCSPISRIIDARGGRRGDASEPEEPFGREHATQATIVALDAEHCVARGAFDEVVMIDHGRVTATASLSDDQTARLDDRTFAVLSCSGGDPDAACHLMRRQVEEQDPGSSSAAITTIDDDRVPRCPRE